jgi:UDP-N-acetylglucosamine--N-acetylmuramyl-(pentapeptide) pyrophosphoryl-undecaprenol N-acetylglucosamine transferase
VKLILGAGGTGGHVFPALAVGLELRQSGAEVTWVGRSGGLEESVAEQHGFKFEPLPAGAFFGKGVAAKLSAGWLLARGAGSALGLLRGLAPNAVVATGGFATAGLLTAAALLGVPRFLMEQNCIPGRVTRFFAPGAKESFLAFPTVNVFPGPHSVTGNPLRSELATGERADDGRTVLFLGGSLGAQALNLAALDAAAALTTLSFIVLAGRRDFEFVRARVRSRNCEVIEFTARPEELYRRATIAVSRAGGVVLSELVAFGIPAILVPFPSATDRHQHANAEYLEKVGASTLLDQNRLSGLTSLIRTLMDDLPRRGAMELAARSVARPDAASAISRRISECLAA